MIDEVEVRKAISAIKGDSLFEIRIIPAKGKPISGYFKSADKAVECLKKQNLKDTNVYIVLNAIDDACYDREQKDKFVMASTTTSDSDIVAREWLLVDLDPKRPKGTSSTQEQIEKALDKCGKIHNFLLEQGLPRPIIGFSGNGYHLLYRLKMRNTDEHRDLVKQFLSALDELFSDGIVNVDVVNFNAARVCKLYGTMAQKGVSSEERPHRMSKIVKIPDEIIPVESAYLKKICNLVKPQETTKPSRYNNYSSSDFDIEDWMNKYGLRYTAYSYGSGTKYCLEHCPFDEGHTKKDAAIFKRSNGAIAFKCLHNSCADKTWQDVRKLFEPDAYDKKREWEERQTYKQFNRNEKPEPKKIVPKEGVSVFYTPLEIAKRPKQTEQIIKSGIELFDKKFRGFRKKDVTILSGQTGSAKSTLLSELILNAVEEGNNVGVFSGELDSTDFMRWMNQQAAGKAYVEPAQWEGYYNVPYKYQLKIAEWLEGKLWIYNNEYGFNFQAMIDEFQKKIDEHKLDMLCIDNLMALDISDLSKDKYEAQSLFVWQLQEIAKVKNVHIIVVCHPRKPTGLLGLYDISGSSDIVNAVSNLIYVYRVNQVFKNDYQAVFGREYKEDATNVWHCAKVRFGSVDDSYGGLYYEKESKRLKNEPTESKNYGWLYKDEPQQETKVQKSDRFNNTPPDEEIPFD